MMWKIVRLFTLVFFTALVGKAWHWAKDGFSIDRTRFPLEEEASAFESLDPEIVAAVNQPFTYLGRGHQCYAFESQDGQYVLKLLRYDRYLLPFWLRALDFSFLDEYKRNLKCDKARRLSFMLSSFRIAFNDLKRETALLYLHLNRSDHFGSAALIFDAMGRKYTLDLNRTAFILQRKKALMMPAFQKALSQGDRETAKQILNAFIEVIATRARKGIFNKDPSFLRNFAYDAGEGIQIDIGSFYRTCKESEEALFRPSFLQTVGHVQQWLNGIDPEMGRWFNTRIREIVEK